MISNHSFIYCESNLLYIIKWRKDINSEVNSRLTVYRSKGDFHVESDVFEVFRIEMNGLDGCHLTYLSWIPRKVLEFKTLCHLFSKKARAVGTFRREAAIIHEEIFGSSPELRVVDRDRGMSKEIRDMIKRDIENEEKLEFERLKLDMNDRKHKYDMQKLTTFVKFREKMIKKMGEEATKNLTDNAYCRFLDGYNFNLEECEKNMTNYIVQNFNA